MLNNNEYMTYLNYIDALNNKTHINILKSCNVIIKSYMERINLNHLLFIVLVKYMRHLKYFLQEGYFC